MSHGVHTMPDAVALSSLLENAASFMLGSLQTSSFCMFLQTTEHSSSEIVKMSSRLL